MVACGGSLVQGIGLRGHSYLFDNPKNDIYYVKQNTIKHEPFSVY